MLFIQLTLHETSSGVAIQFLTNFMHAPHRKQMKGGCQKCSGKLEKEQMEISIYGFETWSFSGTLDKAVNRNHVAGVGVGKKSTIEKQHYILILFHS